MIAVDGYTDMVQEARKRLKTLHQVEVRRGDMEALPIDDAQLDIAVVALVLHHVPEPQRALADVYRTLKRGGRVMIVDMLPHDRVEYQQQMGHVWLGFSEKQITRLLTGAGFTDVRIRALPIDPDAKGPALFAAIATRE